MFMKINKFLKSNKSTPFILDFTKKTMYFVAYYLLLKPIFKERCMEKSCSFNVTQ